MFNGTPPPQKKTKQKIKLKKKIYDEQILSLKVRNSGG